MIECKSADEMVKLFQTLREEYMDIELPIKYLIYHFPRSMVGELTKNDLLPMVFDTKNTIELQVKHGSGKEEISFFAAWMEVPKNE